MISKHDLVGKKFSRLKVLEKGNIKKYKNQTKVYWKCLCDCGKIKEIVSGSLTNNLIKSCGCLAKEKASKRLRKHGLSSDRIYKIWSRMCQRTRFDRNFEKNKYYEGVKLCPRWHKFELFFLDMGLPPTKKHQIDRINPYGNYEPKNCRWATPSENMLNQKRNYIMYGEYQSFSKPKCSYQTYRRRVLSGWEKEKAIINRKYKNQFD
jgi:hypothetical protein